MMFPAQGVLKYDVMSSERTYFKCQVKLSDSSERGGLHGPGGTLC